MKFSRNQNDIKVLLSYNTFHSYFSQHVLLLRKNKEL